MPAAATQPAAFERDQTNHLLFAEDPLGEHFDLTVGGGRTTAPALNGM
jgi:hypothetical protein